MQNKIESKFSFTGSFRCEKSRKETNRDFVRSFVAQVQQHFCFLVAQSSTFVLYVIIFSDIHSSTRQMFMFVFGRRTCFPLIARRIRRSFAEKVFIFSFCCFQLKFFCLNLVSLGRSQNGGMRSSRTQTNTNAFREWSRVGHEQNECAATRLDSNATLEILSFSETKRIEVFKRIEKRRGVSSSLWLFLIHFLSSLRSCVRWNETQQKWKWQNSFWSVHRMQSDRM